MKNIDDRPFLPDETYVTTQYMYNWNTWLFVLNMHRNYGTRLKNSFNIGITHHLWRRQAIFIKIKKKTVRRFELWDLITKVVNNVNNTPQQRVARIWQDGGYKVIIENMLKNKKLSWRQTVLCPNRWQMLENKTLGSDSIARVSSRSYDLQHIHLY